MKRATLIMPLYNEAADIADVLRSLDAQTFLHEALTLLVVDGGSTDGSREIVEAWFHTSDIDGHVMHNPLHTIPSSLNAALRRTASNEVVVRLDAHTFYASNYIATLMEAFDRLPSDIGCVGGAQLPAPETRLDRAVVASLYTNPLGLGGAAYRRASGPRLSDGVYLGAWRPGVLQAVGGFDERWQANEDGELAVRVRELGYRTMFVPVSSAYHIKRGPLATIRQWGAYGYWRAQTLRRHPSAFRARHLAPPLALILTLLALFTPFRAVVVTLYAFYVVAMWLRRQDGEEPLVTLAACVFFPTCQTAWALGLLYGLLNFSSPRAAALRDAV